MAAIPAPRTWVTGDRVTAPRLNADVRDAVNYLCQSPRAKAYRSTSLNLSTNTWAVVGLGGEAFDTDGLHARDNNSRLTFVTPGAYVVSYCTSWAASPSGIRQSQVRKNATGSQAAGVLLVDHNTVAPSGGSARHFASTVEEFQVGDYIEMFAWQNSGGTLGVVAGAQYTFLSVLWVGEL